MYEDYFLELENPPKLSFFGMEANFKNDFLESYKDFYQFTHGKRRKDLFSNGISFNVEK